MMKSLSIGCRFASLGLVAFAACSALALPMREWDWHMPGNVYKDLDFSDRAQVDRAVKIFQQAIDAENRNTKVTDLVPRYRAAAGEWRKVQVQGETGDGNESVLAYAVFMQGYARQQAHDRNEALKLYNEVLDLYPEQKFISVPARYMLSVVRRELGDVKQANAELEEIADDKAAEGHVIYYNVLRSLASVRWGQDRLDEAAELWSKIVFSKGKPDGTLWNNSRNDLIAALVITRNFDELERAIYAGTNNDKKKQAQALAANAKWISESDRYWWHGITQYLDARWPKDKKASERKNQLMKIRKAYIDWFETATSVFNGYDDGWTCAISRFRTHLGYDKSADVVKLVKILEPLVKNAKPEELDGRVRTLAMELVAVGEKDAARAACDLSKNTLFRLRLQYDVEYAMSEWKAAAMYLSEYIGTKPPAPADALKNAKYDLAWLYRHRLGDPAKAVKIYQDLDDPPRSLWGLCEALRESGKKPDSYRVLVEITSMFPDDAANAVLRTAQWREQDGEKEKAIGLYRQLLKHPKWKQTSASSQAHQALERFGIATGGAMTNEVR